MRDTESVNTKGVAKSRGYAFINFTDHQHAVEALRKTNNDPDLFTDNRVCYSQHKRYTEILFLHQV